MPRVVLISLYDRQLMQVFESPTRDVDVISETFRDRLVNDGLAYRVRGWNAISPDGIIYLINNGSIKEAR